MKFKCEVVEKNIYKFDIEAVDEDDAMDQINDGYHDDIHPEEILCGIVVSPA